MIEELYERYVNSTVPIQEPCIVEDPVLPVQSQSSRNYDTMPATVSQPIAATAPMEIVEEPQVYSNSNHVIIKVYQ
jgi:hypothetical protein